MTTTERAHAPAIEADPDLIELTRLPAVVYTADIYADCIAWPEGYTVNGRREDATEREYHLLRALAATLDGIRKAVGVRPPRVIVQVMRTPLDGRSTAPKPVRLLADTRRDEHGAALITISRIRRR
ncbi:MULTISPECIES: hypothetical protein [Streptomyces]|uniref:hypothetical protein n=1 Tax=Streptomyces TaxID=1883 RepID=UPI0022546529|nr:MULTISPECIES: hypothetical protein [Streptomyces]MCX5278064.1 hypothetical protein [Streptomyces virginiae]